MFTWTDVENRFEKLINDWPQELHYVQAYWSKVIIGWRGEDTISLLNWLQIHFGNQFDREHSKFILEIGDIHLEIDTLDQERCSERIKRLTFKNPLILTRTREESFPEFQESYPPVIAFHSAKGGVGQTVRALGLATALPNVPVLFIDGNFESPGISHLLGDCDIGYADMLALFHSDPEEDSKKAVDIASKYLRNQRFGGMIFLPAFKSLADWKTPTIRPEAIQDISKRSLADRLGQLGAELKVSAVIVDLPSGINELSAPLLFDPRVDKFVVTTPDALDKTCLMIKKFKIPTNKMSVDINFLLPSNLLSPKGFQLNAFEKWALSITKDIPEISSVNGYRFQQQLMGVPESREEILNLVKDNTRSCKTVINVNGV